MHTRPSSSFPRGAFAKRREICIKIRDVLLERAPLLLRPSETPRLHRPWTTEAPGDLGSLLIRASYGAALSLSLSPPFWCQFEQQCLSRTIQWAAYISAKLCASLLPREEDGGMRRAVNLDPCIRLFNSRKERGWISGIMVYIPFGRTLYFTPKFILTLDFLDHDKQEVRPPVVYI